MNFDPRDPKNYILYSMITDDEENERHVATRSGCQPVVAVLLLIVALVLLAMLRG